MRVPAWEFCLCKGIRIAVNSRKKKMKERDGMIYEAYYCRETTVKKRMKTKQNIIIMEDL